MSVTEQLRRLRERIEQEAAGLELWFYGPVSPEFPDIRGWWGTDPAILVGYVPSTGAEMKPPLRLLYEGLRTHKLQSAHLTDVLKVRSPVEKAGALFSDADILQCSRGYLLEEVRIIQRHQSPVPRPCLVAPMGKDARKWVEEWLKGVTGVTIHAIAHYSMGGPANKDILKGLAEVRAWLERWNQAD